MAVDQQDIDNYEQNYLNGSPEQHELKFVGEMIVAPGSGHQVWIPKPEDYSPEMGLLVRDMVMK
jgi:hypothetical protein